MDGVYKEDCSMKNICCVVIVAIIFLSCQIPVFAFYKTIDEEEINIGGISIGSSLDYVEQIYGTPTSKKNFDDIMGNGEIYYYNNKLIISALNTKNGTTYVNDIVCRESNLTTPSGFAVGTSYENVLKKYKKVEPLSKDRVNNYKQNYIYYEHTCGNLYMRFTVDKKGIIQEIECYMDS